MLTRRLLLGGAAMVPFAARADDTYPNKPIRVILPGPVGGLIDIAGRAISEATQKDLGQPWLIDPRPGANGIMAGQLFVAAPSDGYTLFLTVSGHLALPFVMKVPYDVVADFRPIAMIGISTALLCVPPASPAGTETAPARICCPSCSRSNTGSTSPRSPTRDCRPACRICWPTVSTSRW